MKKSYCGRVFSPDELELIRKIIAQPQLYPNRAAIARAVCGSLSWLRPDGQPKLMSARLALLRMHNDGLVVLPPPTCGNGNGRCRPSITTASDPGAPVEGTPKTLSPIGLRLVQNKKDSSLWNEIIARYHYLGYVPLPGAQARYFIEGNGRILGAIGMGAAAWKVAPRDNFIGWSPGQRQKNLHLVVNNTRFLILPWVRVKNLASFTLACLARRLGQDWNSLYGYRPVLLETFVEQDRFQGTCYKAANWIYVGHTQGRGKMDRFKLRNKPVKKVFLFPLTKNFRETLAAPYGFTE